MVTDERVHAKSYNARICLKWSASNNTVGFSSKNKHFILNLYKVTVVFKTKDWNTFNILILNVYIVIFLKICITIIRLIMHIIFVCFNIRFLTSLDNYTKFLIQIPDYDFRKEFHNKKIKTKILEQHFRISKTQLQNLK